MHEVSGKEKSDLQRELKAAQRESEANAGAAEERDKLLQEKLESVDELAELKLRLEEATEYEAQVEAGQHNYMTFRDIP